jgi:hypothetical protein
VGATGTDFGKTGSRRRVVWALLPFVLGVALLVPASSNALVVGVGDEHPSALSTPLFQQLHVKRTRYLIPFDAIFTQRPALDAWMTAARSAQLEVMVAFQAPSWMRCPQRPCTPPHSGEYTRAFRAFRHAYPWVRIFSPWNEVNDIHQPTRLNPQAVVAYYRVVRRDCRGCTVLGGDLLDVWNEPSYAKRLLALYRHAGLTPHRWGLHNYGDVNYFLPDRASSVRRMLSILPGKAWLTETGGIHHFTPPGRTRVWWGPDPARQARAADYLMREAIRWRIDRVYWYQWAAAAGDRWDSGLVDPDGTPRPALVVLANVYGRYFH